MLIISSPPPHPPFPVFPPWIPLYFQEEVGVPPFFNNPRITSAHCVYFFIRGIGCYAKLHTGMENVFKTRENIHYLTRMHELTPSGAPCGARAGGYKCNWANYVQNQK
jgi:hypothetical protein